MHIKDVWRNWDMIVMASWHLKKSSQRLYCVSVFCSVSTAVVQKFNVSFGRWPQSITNETEVESRCPLFNVTQIWICRVTHKKASNNNTGFIGASFQPWPWNYGKNKFKFEAVIITFPLPLLLSIREQMKALFVCDPIALISFPLTSLWLFLNLQTVPVSHGATRVICTLPWDPAECPHIRDIQGICFSLLLSPCEVSMVTVFGLVIKMYHQYHRFISLLRIDWSSSSVLAAGTLRKRFTAYLLASMIFTLSL